MFVRFVPAVRFAVLIIANVLVCVYDVSYF
jgi:hypothetical protein